MVTIPDRISMDELSNWWILKALQELEPPTYETLLDEIPAEPTLLDETVSSDDDN